MNNRRVIRVSSARAALQNLQYLTHRRHADAGALGESGRTKAGLWLAGEGRQKHGGVISHTGDADHKQH